MLNPVSDVSMNCFYWVINFTNNQIYLWKQTLSHSFQALHYFLLYEPHYEKTGFLHMRKQRR